MTVGELKEKLNEFPDDALVWRLEWRDDLGDRCMHIDEVGRVRPYGKGRGRTMCKADKGKILIY